MATRAIPDLVGTLFKLLENKPIFSRSAVERKVELGYLADCLTAETVLNSNSVTLIFNATTQTGIILIVFCQQQLHTIVCQFRNCQAELLKITYETFVKPLKH